MVYRTSFAVVLSGLLAFGEGCAARQSLPEAAPYKASYGEAVAADSSPSSEEGGTRAQASMPVGVGRGQPARQVPAVPMPAGPAAAAGLGAAGAPASKGKQAASDKVASSEEAPGTPILIYAGALALLVDPAAFAATIDSATELATKLGGFVGRHDDRSVTLRVPSTHFREAMRELEKLGAVQSRNVAAEDVTEEFHDLDVRLRSLQATRKRLEELLQKAANIHDVLEVEEQLARVTGEIDRIEGRIRFLQSHAALSTITVTLAPKTPTALKTLAPLPPRTIPLPIGWFSSLGIDYLLELSR